MAKVSATSVLSHPNHRCITFVTRLSHHSSVPLVWPLSAQELRVSPFLHDLRLHGPRLRVPRLPIRSPLVHWSHRRRKVRAKVIHLPVTNLRCRTWAPTKLTELRTPRVRTLPRDLLPAPDKQRVCLPRRSLPTPVLVAWDLCPRQHLRGVRPPVLAAALDHTCRPLSRSLLEPSGIIDSNSMNSMKIRSIAPAVPSVYKSNGFFKSPTLSSLLQITEGQYTIQMLIMPKDPLPLLVYTIQMLTTPRDPPPLPLAQDHPRWLGRLEERRVPAAPLRWTGKDGRSIRPGKKHLLCIWMEDCTSNLCRVCQRVLHHLPIRNKMDSTGFRCVCCFFSNCAICPPYSIPFIIVDLSLICYLIISIGIYMNIFA